MPEGAPRADVSAPATRHTYDDVIDPDVDLRDPAQLSETLRREWDLLAAIAVGGVLGALARYQLEHVFAAAGGGFPVATLIVNVSGCCVIGGLMVLLLEFISPHRLARPFLSTGLLGGYTTFSTFAVQTQQLLAAQRPLLALGYVLASVLVCLAAVWMSSASTRALGGWLRGRRAGRPGATP